MNLSDFVGHTKGPWLRGDGKNNAPYVVYSGKVAICACMVAVGPGSRNAKGEEFEANIKLIQAAPELLEYSKFLEKRIKELEQIV